MTKDTKKSHKGLDVLETALNAAAIAAASWLVHALFRKIRGEDVIPKKTGSK